ncbi:MAG: hypothetical protein GQE15_30395 [Archangiaceae bacterium]|nr:hypothetical protein [Archangiaceae bacterium]
MSRLQPARRRYEADDLPGALALLLEIWRQAPDPRLGGLISSMGDLVKLKADAAAWEQQAKLRRPEWLSFLLTNAKATAKVMKERVLLLLEWPPDPRLDRWVVAQYARPPFTSTGSGPFWTALKKLTFKLTDPVAREALAQLDSGRLEGVMLRPLAPTDSLRPDELADLAALEAAILTKTTPTKGERTADQLLGEVLANPADLSLRPVLMDSLLELGDVRGELLALQLKPEPLSAAERKREKALIRDHWAELLGPLAPVLKPDSRFARGFLVHAELRAGLSSAVENALERARGHRLWNTVESFSGEGSVLEAGAFPVLRSVETYRVELSALTRFKTLEAMALRLRPEDLSTLTAPGNLPALHTMTLALTPDLLTSFEPWAVQRVWRSLTFTVEPRDLDAACALLGRPLALTTERLELVVPRFESSSFHARSRLTVEHRPGVTKATVRLELSSKSNQNWAEALLTDAAAMLETVAARPHLEFELSMGNVTPGAASAPLVARVERLGGRVR